MVQRGALFKKKTWDSSPSFLLYSILPKDDATSTPFRLKANRPRSAVGTQSFCLRHTHPVSHAHRWGCEALKSNKYHYDECENLE